MAEKVFIELDEDIIFVVEKIKKVEGENVILVIPERAALLGSVVSLKLLAQEISKTDKLAVLVTQDEVGSKLAKRAKLSVVNKPNDITKEIWDKARKFKKELVAKREKDKEALVKERKEKEEDIKEEASVAKKKIVEEPKKLRPQIVDVGGFEMVSGGDIAEMKDRGEERADTALMSERASEKSEEEVEKKEGSTFSTQEDELEKYSRDTNKERKTKQIGGLVGQDLSSFSYTSVPSKTKARGGEKPKLEIGKSFGRFVDSVKGFFAAGGTRQKVLIGGGVALVVFFLLSYFVFPRGKVLIKVESQDIELDKKIVADTATTTLDVESLTIPAQMLEVAKDSSGSADATGTKETGEHATGQVTIFNMTESEVTVTSGTVLESIESGLKYKTTTDVKVPAKKPDDDPESPGLIGNEDVGVIAESFGEEYNLTKKVEFRVQGFDVENLYGKNFGNLTGGTTEEKQVVSQKDYDDLKKTLKEELKTDLLESLTEEAGTTKELLEDTVKYEVINEDPTPNVDAEADTLNLSISMKATALSFDKEDIDELAQYLVEEENEVSIEVEEFEYSSEVLRTDGNKIHIKLEITGVVTPSVNQDDVKENLTGKSRGAAEEYLNGQSEIKEYEIELSPSWLPSFLAHFPSSTSRIEVSIEKV